MFPYLNTKLEIEIQAQSHIIVGISHGVWHCITEERNAPDMDMFLFKDLFLLVTWSYCSWQNSFWDDSWQDLYQQKEKED